MYLGLSFFTPEKREIGVPRHLWIVLSNPNTDGHVVIANLSTNPSTQSETLLVTPEEHDKISQDSYLRFDQVRIKNSHDIEMLLRKGTLQKTTDTSPALIKKLQEAIIASSIVPIEVQRLFQ